MCMKPFKHWNMRNAGSFKKFCVTWSLYFNFRAINVCNNFTVIHCSYFMTFWLTLIDFAFILTSSLQHLHVFKSPFVWKLQVLLPFSFMQHHNVQQSFEPAASEIKSFFTHTVFFWYIHNLCHFCWVWTYMNLTNLRCVWFEARTHTHSHSLPHTYEGGGITDSRHRESLTSTTLH